MRQRPVNSAFRRKGLTALFAFGRKGKGTSTSEESEISSELNHAWDALRTGDFQAATVHAERVLGKASRRRDNSVNAQLILIKMKAQQGQFTGLLDELEGLFRSNPKMGSNTHALIGNEIVRVCLRSGNLGVGAQRGDEMIRDLGDHWPDIEVVELLLQVSSCHFLRGDLPRAEELVTRALEMAERCKSPKSLAQSYWQLSSLSAGRGNMPMSISQNQEARNWAHLAEMNRILPILNGNAAGILLQLPDQDLAEIHELAESAYLELVAQNDPGSASNVCISLSEIELRQSNFEGAHMYVDMGLTELPPEIPGPRANLIIQKAKIHARTGHYSQSEAEAKVAVDFMKTMEPSRYLATSWGHLARVFVEIGLADRGVFAYEQALQMAGVVREEYEEGIDTDVRRSETNQSKRL